MHRILYILLRQRLQALRIEGTDVPTFKEVEWFRDQVDINDSENPMFGIPACYIEFLPNDFLEGGVSSQNARQEIRLHIVTMIGTLDERVDRTIGNEPYHHQIADQVFTQIQGYHAKASDIPSLASLAGTEDDFWAFNSWQRTTVNTSPNTLPFLVTTMEFKCLAFDPSKLRNWQTISAALVIEAY
jgi:hypothetical protein